MAGKNHFLKQWIHHHEKAVLLRIKKPLLGEADWDSETMVDQNIHGRKIVLVERTVVPRRETVERLVVGTWETEVRKTNVMTPKKSDEASTDIIRLGQFYAG